MPADLEPRPGGIERVARHRREARFVVFLTDPASLRSAAIIAPELHPLGGHLARIVQTDRTVHLPARRYRRYRTRRNAGFIEDLRYGGAYLGPPVVGTLLGPTGLGTVDIVLDLRYAQNLTARAKHSRPDTLRTDVQRHNIVAH